MDDFVSESDSDYTSYWRDWVSEGIPKKLNIVRGNSSSFPRRAAG